MSLRKQAIHNIVLHLGAELNLAIQAAQQARETATNSENAAENRYDTLGLEAAYLAHGQSNRAVDLETSRAEYQLLEQTADLPHTTVKTGSLVKLLTESGQPQYILLGPSGGGLKIKVADKQVLVETVAAPIGVALAGKSVGDDVEFRTGSTLHQFEVLDIV